MARTRSDEVSKSGKPKNITRHIVEDLGRSIVTQVYTPKTGFPFEADLCVKYGASRPVVREAVKMLTAKGLLQARQRAGTVILPESAWSLMDRDVLGWLAEREFSIGLLVEFNQMRMAIEPRAAELAAESASGDQRAAIVAAITRMFAAETGDDDPLEADIAFHRAVIEASNNRFMRQFADLSEIALRYSIRLTNEYAGRRLADAADHQKVSQAIVEGNAALADHRMRDLIKGALDLLLEAAE